MSRWLTDPEIALIRKAYRQCSRETVCRAFCLSSEFLNVLVRAHGWRTRRPATGPTKPAGVRRRNQAEIFARQVQRLAAEGSNHDAIMHRLKAHRWEVEAVLG